MKNIVVISSSFRRDGNTDTMVQAFVKGAKDAGNNVELITLKDIELNFCKGCFACQRLKRCIMTDGVSEILETVRNADILVFATPLYFYSMSGQLKTFIDRLTPLHTIGHNFKEVYLLVAAADHEESSINCVKQEIQGWADCFSDVELTKTIFVGDVNEIGDIHNFPQQLNEIYKIAKQI